MSVLVIVEMYAGPCRMLPSGEWRWVYAACRTYRQTDARPLVRYITLTARRGQRDNGQNVACVQRRGAWSSRGRGGRATEEAGDHRQQSQGSHVPRSGRWTSRLRRQGQPAWHVHQPPAALRRRHRALSSYNMAASRRGVGTEQALSATAFHLWGTGAVLPDTNLLTGILQPQWGHFLNPEGARMQDFALEISKDSSGLYPVPKPPRPAASRMGAVKTMH